MTFPVLSSNAAATNIAFGVGATCIAAPDMYRMSKIFCDDASVLPMSVNGQRMLHALLHRTCRDLLGWSPEIRQPPDGHRAQCMALRHTLGLEKARGNRDLTAGVADLNETNIFERIHFEHGNTWLTWRFDDAMLRTILDGDRYGLLDASALRKFRKVADYQIFGQVSVARRTRKAAFEINMTQAWIWTEKVHARWSDVSAIIIEAIRLSCAHYGLTAVVLLEGRGSLTGVDTVVVRLRRRGGLWSVSDIAKCSVWTRRCLVIDGSRHIRVTPTDLPSVVAAVKKVGWHLERFNR